MKYEMILGDEKLFDGAPLDSVCVERFINHELVSVYVHYRTIDALLNTLIERDAVSCASNRPDIAMRRIIKEPGIWTWEDKKAGRLPEVGCRVDFCHKLNTNWRTGEIKYIDNQVAVIKADDIDRPFVYEVDRVEFKPIESPEEKAARLRSEWCIKTLSYCSILSEMQKYELKRLSGYIEDIYDALPSGELTMPNKDGE